MKTTPSLLSLFKDWLEIMPDDQQLKGLSRWMKPQLWKGIGSSEHCLWGEVKTKGSLFYKVVLDKKRRAQGCTCAHPVFPCTHALALLTAWHEGVVEVNTMTHPHWVEERLLQPSIQKEPKEKPKKTVGDQRQSEMKAGYAFLQTWLLDQTREGWRRTLDPPATHLEEVATRLVNERLPGPARLLRSLILPPTMLEDTTSRFQTHIASLTLASRLFLQGPDANPNLWPHLLQFSGITQRKDQIRKQEPVVHDHWIQLAQLEEQEDDGLQQRTTWLYGMQHQRFALILDFAWKRQPLPPALPAHPMLKGEMTFYPGSQNLRAIPGELSPSERSLTLIKPAFSGWSPYFDWLIAYRTLDPFTHPIPAWVAGHFIRDNDILSWADDKGQTLPLVCPPNQIEFLDSFLGMPKLTLFGLVYVHRFKPLALFSEGQKIDF